MKKKVLTDLRVVCDPPRYVGRYSTNMEDKAKLLEEWCEEFKAFVRDHRSQDPIDLTVERVHEYVCSHCGSEWDDELKGECCDEAAKELATGYRYAL